MMSLRPLAEAKNTVEHSIAAQERAHYVHMKITLFVSVLRRSSTTNCCLTALPGGFAAAYNVEEAGGDSSI